MHERHDWEITGAASETIYGTAYVPSASPVGCAIIAHGFKGYKDFRMIPAIANQLRSANFVAHTLNFSHSGMTRNPDTFERPELFQRDTWNKQVFDIRCVVEAISRGDLIGAGLPYVIVGHSRGGVSALLFAARNVGDDQLPQPSGIVVAGSPSYTCGLSAEQEQQLRATGWLESPSARTGQVLRVGRLWLTEQEEEPEKHDLLRLIPAITCPLLVIHGEQDETVDVSHAKRLAETANTAELVRLADCNHVFNTPNPPPDDVESIPALHRLTAEINAFARRTVD